MKRGISCAAKNPADMCCRKRLGRLAQREPAICLHVSLVTGWHLVVNPFAPPRCCFILAQRGRQLSRCSRLRARPEASGSFAENGIAPCEAYLCSNASLADAGFQFESHIEWLSMSSGHYGVQHPLEIGRR